jgi:hypothetical protein
MDHRMHLDPDGRHICGVLPGVLKRLLRHDQFYPQNACEILGLDQAGAVDLAQRLRANGWLEGDDYKVAYKGQSLRANKLNVKRFPKSVGVEIIQKVVVEASLINLEELSCRVETIDVFGSCVYAADDALVGDVDLAITIHRRSELGEAEIKRREKEERRLDAPYWLDWFARSHWPTTRIERRLKKLDRRISMTDSLHFLAPTDMVHPVFPTWGVPITAVQWAKHRMESLRAG